MKAKTIFCEGISPTGHTTFTTGFLQLMARSKDTFFVGNSIEDKIDFNGKRVVFNDNFVRSSRPFHAIAFFALCLKILIHAKFRRFDRVVFFSYDILTIPFISLVAFSLRIKLTVFEHNTVPKSKSNCILQSMAVGVNRLCFTPCAVEKFKSLGQRTELISLPIQLRKKWESAQQVSKSYVFCPSASASLSRIIHYAEKNPDVIFYVKSSTSNSLPNNVVAKSFFADYDYWLEKCSLVYVPLSNTDRMSGPVIDAISYGKPVVMTKDTLSVFLSKKYHGYIFFDDLDVGSIISKYTRDSSSRPRLKELNEQLQKRLNEIY